MRTCVVCRTRRDDAELVRAGRNPDGSWYLGRGVGRGVWFCAGSDCGASLQVAHLARALRAPVSDLEVVALRERATGKRP